MNDLPISYYRKTNHAIPLDIIDHYPTLELLAAIDEDKDILRVEQSVEMEPSVFKKSFLNLVELGLIEPN